TPAVPEVPAVADAQLGTGVTGAGLRRRVADRGAVLDRALARDCPAGGEKCLEQAGLSGLVRSNEHGAACGAVRSSCHVLLPRFARGWPPRRSPSGGVPGRMTRGRPWSEGNYVGTPGRPASEPASS